MSDKSSFQEFLSGISTFLDQYDIVFRISKDDGKTTHSLIITPIPKYENLQIPIFVPIRITGELEEIVAIMEDPQRGMRNLAAQMQDMELTPIEQSEKPKPKGTRRQRKVEEPASAAPELAIADPAAPGAVPTGSEIFNAAVETLNNEGLELDASQNPMSIVPDEPIAEVKLPPISNTEQPAPPTPPKRALFTEQPADDLKKQIESIRGEEEAAPTEVSDQFEEYRKLSQNITLEIRGIATDWNDVQSMWKKIMEVYKSFDKKIQEDFKPRLQALHKAIKEAQDRDKALLAKTAPAS